MFHAGLYGRVGCPVWSFKLLDPCTFHVPNGRKVGNDNIELANADGAVRIRGQE